jgi:pantoate--beta-alanine ligase
MPLSTTTPRLAIVQTVPALRKEIAVWRRSGFTVGLIPTMGGLHAGHLSLVGRALREVDHAVATIFVNPKQFGPGEDLDRYPRQEARDAAVLAESGASLLFAPSVDEMYPAGFATNVGVAGLTEPLDGPLRPGHFDGVATAVTKLLLQTLPDVAVFGEKDYQQLLVIRRVVQDLDIPVSIIGAPTVREADGLAMSTRNAYLSPEERSVAPAIYRTLRSVAARLRAGDPANEALSRGRQALADAGITRIDYLDLRDGETLAALTAPTPQARLFIAAWLGQTRLIDNITVAEH